MTTQVDTLTLNPNADSASIIQGKDYRFTVLTENLIRMEYSDDGMFVDSATQSIINRNFSVPSFHVVENERGLEIITSALHLYYMYGEFSKTTLYIDVKNNYSAYSNRWYYGDKIETLKGTARTLDNIDGAVPLEDGIHSLYGFSIIDDSKSSILLNDEEIISRRENQTDLYFFAYGRNFKKGLTDFFKLTGNTPLLPRYALGNWWSRFWKYSDEDYKSLMLKFKEENIPFSLSVLDMDWHVVDIPEKYGSGWTGYSWNKTLFPNPEHFLKWLHENGLKVTLNVHPADGVRPHEDMYESMAEELGIDIINERPIPFDITDPDFRAAYFKYLHHTQEEKGVDFWWIDWQQGTTSKVKGLDPLWLLNHYHSLDLAKQNKRPLILSRYAGIGSHRYPLGFSGDATITWESYRFQPYFTATATNVGYGWWSHDIGGHYKGYKDDELSLRWLQFGVFSPIMRLHSSSSPFNGKEPWRYQNAIAEIMKDYLRLRHQLIPYLYTMNWNTHQNLRTLIMPMYYEHPNESNAYNVPNQYYFGSELIVAPVLNQIDKELLMAPIDMWIPEGDWIDFFSGRIYKGGKNKRLFRDLKTMPILAKPGAIIPMAEHHEGDNSIENPSYLSIIIFPGASNYFELYEDDGETLEYKNGKYAVTKMSLDWGNKIFKLSATNGDLSVIPSDRKIILKFRGFRRFSSVTAISAGVSCILETAFEPETQTTSLSIPRYDNTHDLTIILPSDITNQSNNRLDALFKILNSAQMSFELKDELYELFISTNLNTESIISELRSKNINSLLFDAILEQLID